MAVFTYQLAYWGWVKLETEEIKSQRDGMSFFSSFFVCFLPLSLFLETLPFDKYKSSLV